MRSYWGIWVISLHGIALAVACGSDPEIAGAGSSFGGSDDGSGGKTASSSGGMRIVVPGEAGSTGEGGTGGAGVEVGCGLLSCPLGQHCVESAGQASCVDTDCSGLTCKATEECQPAPGSGHYCKSIACDSDVDCPEARYCDGNVCVDDACEPDTRTCKGNQVHVCASNGSGADAAYSCHSAGYFTSDCSTMAGTSAAETGCTCEGDWDCPEYTSCEAGVCVGTGVAPTCTLPPTPFEDVLPKQEFRWGGTDSKNDADEAATGKPFPWSAQVLSTPIIVNLDDDNGDGFINELDFPEILFMSYNNNWTDAMDQVHASAPERNGIVRAIHGGGPNKGKDYFALCATTHWFEGEPVVSDCEGAVGSAQTNDKALGRAGGALAAGDLDGDGVPEIVVPLENGGLQILDNHGEIISTSAAGLWPDLASGFWRYPAPAIANIDFDGFAEIVVGDRVLTLKKDSNGKLVVDQVFTGNLNEGVMHNGGDARHHGPTVCLADLTSDPGLELVAGTTLYRLPDVADCATAPNSDYCQKRLTVVWNAKDVPANAGKITYSDGFCAVADVLGADTSVAAAPGPDNPLDQVPEILVMADGTLLILNASDGTVLRSIALGGGAQGGAPNVDDFDGDGFPEIAIALSDFYTVIDLQDPEASNCPAWNSVLKESEQSPGTNKARSPGGACSKNADCNAGAVCNQRAGQCVCLHSGWKRDTEDDSSKVTSSSVFDFNGDGAAEVIYNDECYFRVYDGASGGTYLQLPSLSRTVIENPVVADVDNDGNAEIVFVQNNETIQCHNAMTDSKSLNSWPDGMNDVPLNSLPNGLAVYGDPSDVWVSARRVWNEHSYHVTNVTEGGQIPLHEPEHYKPLNGRLYNTYRSQPRNYGVAPDLTLTAIQVSSPDVACGELSDEITIAVQVKNAGDLRVGPGVVLSFSGLWTKPALEEPLVDTNGDPLDVTLSQSLEPGASTIITVTYVTGSNGRDDLPAEVKAAIDANMSERECHEDNNEITGPVAPSEALADLRLVIDSAKGCDPAKVSFTLYNDGATPAENILVRIYGGDPAQGGQVLGEITIAGPLAPGEKASDSVELGELVRDITVYGIADPLNSIAECNDANNLTMGPTLLCKPLTR